MTGSWALVWEAVADSLALGWEMEADMGCSLAVVNLMGVGVGNLAQGQELGAYRSCSLGAEEVGSLG